VCLSRPTWSQADIVLKTAKRKILQTIPHFSCLQDTTDLGEIRTGSVVDYSGHWTKQTLDHSRHVHFFKKADISDGPISKLKLQKLLFLVTKS